MGFIDRIFGRQKTFYNLQELSRIITSGNWDNQSLLNQYEKSLYVFASINKIAQKISGIDLKLFEIINSKGELKEFPAHEILDLLYRPNPYQTRSEFWKITMINKKLTGEAFWLKIRDGRRKVIELWNLRPDLITIHTDPQSYIKSYELTKSNGEKVFFEPTDIIHFKEPNPLDSFRGLSPLKSGIISISLITSVSVTISGTMVSAKKTRSPVWALARLTSSVVITDFGTPKATRMSSRV